MYSFSYLEPVCCSMCTINDVTSFNCDTLWYIHIVQGGMYSIVLLQTHPCGSIPCWDCVHAKSLQLCPTLCDPMDHSPLGPSVHGILQAWTLEWVAMPSSRGSSQPKEWTRVSYFSCIGRWVLYHYCHLLRLHSIPIHEYITICNLYVYSFVDGRLNYLWFEYWAIKNKVSMNIHAQVFVWTYRLISLRWMPRSEIIELCGKCMFNVTR